MHLGFGSLPQFARGFLRPLFWGVSIRGSVHRDPLPGIFWKSEISTACWAEHSKPFLILGHCHSVSASGSTSCRWATIYWWYPRDSENVNDTFVSQGFGEVFGVLPGLWSLIYLLGKMIVKLSPAQWEKKHFTLTFPLVAILESRPGLFRISLSSDVFITLSIEWRGTLNMITCHFESTLKSVVSGLVVKWLFILDRSRCRLLVLFFLKTINNKIFKLPEGLRIFMLWVSLMSLTISVKLVSVCSVLNQVYIRPCSTLQIKNK